MSGEQLNLGQKGRRRETGKTNSPGFPLGHRQVTPAFLFLCSTFLYVLCDRTLSLEKDESHWMKAN